MKDEEKRLVAGLIHKMWGLVLCGSPTPEQADAYRLMKQKKFGSYVVELSTFRQKRAGGVGRLVLVRYEPMRGWDEKENGGEPAPAEEVFYIETFDGEIARWTNADFASAPLEEGEPGENLKWALEARKRHKL